MLWLTIGLEGLLFNTLQYIQIAVIPVRMNHPKVDRIFHCTARLIDMHTIIEMALVDQSPHFRVIMRQLIPGDVYQSQLSNTRGVDHPAPK